MTYSRLCQFALAYAKHGWWVVPIPHRKKSPVDDGWEKLRFGPREIIRTFNVDVKMNLGVILGASGVVDIDLDCEEARRLAEYLLPPTPMRFGRNAAPGSHWVYTAQLNGERTKQYEGPGQDMICELRCSPGSQTVFPPSTHESGDVIGFESKDDPAHADVSKLYEAVGEVAAASLLLRHYPSQGSRHRYAMGIAGGLLRSNWRLERAERFIEAIATEAGDEEIADRIAAVGTTKLAISEGREVIGWPRVGEIIDGSEPKQQFVARIRRHLGIDRNPTPTPLAVSPPPAAMRPITREPASTEPYRAGESMTAINEMAATGRVVKEQKNILALQIAEWLDRRGPQALFTKIDHPIAYAAAAIGISVSYLYKLAETGRIRRCLPLGDNDVTASERTLRPLGRLLESHPEEIPKAFQDAKDQAKADADREGRTKARPVRPKHVVAVVDAILGPVTHTLIKRKPPPNPRALEIDGVRRRIEELAAVAASILGDGIPADIRARIVALAEQDWCRQ